MRSDLAIDLEETRRECRGGKAARPTRQKLAQPELSRVEAAGSSDAMAMQNHLQDSKLKITKLSAFAVKMSIFEDSALAGDAEQFK